MIFLHWRVNYLKLTYSCRCHGCRFFIHNAARTVNLANPTPVSWVDSTGVTPPSMGSFGNHHGGIQSYHGKPPRVQTHNLGGRRSGGTVAAAASPMGSTGIQILAYAPTWDYTVGGSTMLIILSRPDDHIIPKSPAVVIVTFGVTSVQGRFLNPYTISCKIPSRSIGGKVMITIKGIVNDEVGIHSVFPL